MRFCDFQCNVDFVYVMSYCLTVIRWNAEKNEILAKERGITFEEIVQRIEQGASVFDVEHSNPVKYPNQRILVVDVDGYAYLVPYVEENGDVFFKTVIPSRKATKKYLGETQ